MNCMKIIKTKIDWKKESKILSPEAYYMLHMMYIHKDMDVNDTNIRDITGYGLGRHKKYKHELVEAGLLKVVQISRYEYKYIISRKAIELDDEKYYLKTIIDDMKESFLILNMREPDEDELRELKRHAVDVHNDNIGLDDVFKG